MGALLIGAVIFTSPILALANLSLKNETYSHISLIPAVSLFFIWIQRKSIFADTVGKPLAGLAVCASGLAAYALALIFHEQLDAPAFRNQDVSNDYLTLCMAGAVAWVIGSFVAAYGTVAFRKARFALLFMVLAIPLPMFLLNGVIKALQLASAEAANLVFTVLGVPYHRDGLVFQFPNVSVEVAEQCSGIRSSLSLIILSIIMGYMFLKSARNRVLLALAVFPITVFKNALRITTLTLLANYVDMRFLSNHWLHSSGGIPFFAAALAMLIPVVWLFRRSEKPVAPIVDKR